MTLQSPVSNKKLALVARAAHGAVAQRVSQVWPQTFSRGRLVYAAVLIPTLIAALYFGLMASDRYVSESDFVVRGVSSRRATGLEMFFQTFGIARTVDDANAIQSYLLSRDALRALETKLPIREIFHSKNVDIFSRFPRFYRGDSFERLYDYYLDHVTVVNESSKGISKLRVEAFTPADSQRIATELLALGEQLVNRLNQRAQADAIKSAENEVGLAEQRVIQAQKDLTKFRFESGLIDPGKDSNSLLETITSLSTELARVLAQVTELRRTSPTSPSIAAQQARADSLRASIAAERRKLAGGDSDLAAKLATYEELSLNRALAETSLAGASVSLETARQEARRQSIYLETIVAPYLADESTEPQRLRMVVTVFVLCFAVASVVWLLSAGAKEHVIE